MALVVVVVVAAAVVVEEAVVEEAMALGDTNCVNDPSPLPR